METKFVLCPGLNDVAIGFGNEAIYQMWSIAQSAGASTDTSRIGDAVRVQSLDFYLRTYIASGADICNAVRFIIFYWKGYNNVPPTNAQLLQFAATANSPFSPINHDFRDNFQVVRDKVINLSYYGGNQYIYHKKINLRNKLIKFSAGSATVGFNQLYIFITSDSNGTLDPILTYTGRVNFTDA